MVMSQEFAFSNTMVNNFGKRIEFSNRISDWDWMEMNNRMSEDYGDWDTIGNIYQPVPGREYIMHEDGKPRAGGKTVVEI